MNLERISYTRAQQYLCSTNSIIWRRQFQSVDWGKEWIWDILWIPTNLASLSKLILPNFLILKNVFVNMEWARDMLIELACKHFKCVVESTLEIYFVYVRREKNESVGRGAWRNIQTSHNTPCAQYTLTLTLCLALSYEKRETRRNTTTSSV